MYKFSMDHLDSLKPVPQYYAVNDPLPSGLEFPGCKSVPLPCGEIETHDGRLEFWDARTETAPALIRVKSNMAQTFGSPPTPPPSPSTPA